MGNSHDENEYLGKERHAVPDGEVVVHGAKIICDFSQGSNPPNFLSVIDGHGFMEAGKHCAHDGNCIPMKNITPFSVCTCPNAEKALSALSANSSGELKKRCDAALAVISTNTTSHAFKPVPCALPLLDRWFDADEKEVVTSSMGIGSEIIGDIASLNGKMSLSLDKGANANFNETHKSTYTGSSLTEKEKQAYLDKSNQLKTIKTTINGFCTNILEKLNTKIQLKGEDFADIVEQLKTAKTNVENIRTQWNDAYKSYKNLEKYQTYKESLDEYIDNIDTAIEDIENMEENEYHLITTNSFLVCRCGGIITVNDSGQDYETIMKTLTSSIVTIVTDLKEYCQQKKENTNSADKDDWERTRSSYGAAASGLEEFEQLLLGTSESTKDIGVCIYMEIVCHSYNDEIKKVMMSVLSLISLMPGAGGLGIALALYALVTADYNDEDNVADIAEGISADIDLLESLSSENGKGGAVTQSGFGAVIKFNALNTIVSSVTNFFYVSYETWVENINITVFTDSHALVNRCKLKRTGEIIDKKDIEMYKEKEYTSGDLGRGLKWKEDPGVYMNDLVHKMDNKDGGTKIENSKNMAQEMPIS